MDAKDILFLVFSSDCKNPPMIGCDCDSLQQDFENLEVDGAISNEPTLASERMPQDSPDLKRISSEAKQFMNQKVDMLVEESFGAFVAFDVMVGPTLNAAVQDLRPSILQQFEEPSTNTETSRQRSAEPIRTTIHPSPSSRRPKRFFRTFWRGIATRAVAMDGTKKSVPA
jgi:hypothetical protein